VSFALLRAMTALPAGTGEWVVLAERAKELADASVAAESVAPKVSGASRTLARVAEAFAAERDRATASGVR
jgi:hypothetical protein